MKILDFYDDRSNLREVVERAVKVLEDGRVMVYPTDTVYGLGCDAGNTEALKRIFKLKERDDNKPLSVVVRDLAMIKKYAFVGDREEKIIKKLLPGKFTLVLRRKSRALPRALTAGQNTIGVRIPDYDLTSEISRRFRNPYVSTSVNVSGEEPEVWGVDIIRKFQESYDQPDLMIDAGKLGTEAGDPVESTVVDVSGKKPRILRRGELTPSETMKILRL